jgi:uncharacterized protein (DUF1810 family)
MTRADLFDLERFVTAQEVVFPAVLAELKAGRKRTHWMWFGFPQLRGLGHSSMATFYGIASLHEARAYLGHPLLEPRLDLCTRIVLELEVGSLQEIFGSPDDMKFQSSMTLADRPRDCNPSAGRRNRVGPVALGLSACKAEGGRSRMRRSPGQRSSIHQPPAKIGNSDVR